VGERVTREPECLPVVHRFCSDPFVECYRKLVPGEHRPVQTAAIALDCDARKLAQQGKADAVLPRRRPDEKVFQIDTALAEPGRIVVKEKGEPGGLVAEVGDQDFRGGLLAEQGLSQILLRNGRFAGKRALVFGKLENEVTNERDVFLRRRDNPGLYQGGTHSRIIRLAESGVNAIFRRMNPTLTRLFALTLTASACGSPSPQIQAGISAQDPSGARRLPTGARLDPAGVSHDLGSMPLAMTISPEKNRLIVLLNGWREQGIQVVDRASGRVLQTIPLPAVFLGVTFSPDGKSLYVSGGNEDVIYRFDWHDGQATLADSIALAVKQKGKSGTRYPAGIAISHDGRTLYAAENLGDSLAVVDLAAQRVVQRLATERYPYGVVTGPNGTVYVSAWGGWTVSAFPGRAGGTLEEGRRIRVARHPSALLLSPDGSRLFAASGSTDRVSVIDTRNQSVVATLIDASPAATGEGSTPNALALSPDGTRLFVAEADNNAVAVFDLSASTSGASTGSGNDMLAGRIPVGWYPSAVAVDGGDIVVVNGKGRGTAPNVGHWQPGQPMPPHTPDYTLGQINGTLTIVPEARTNGAELDGFSNRVATVNGWNAAQQGKRYPPFEHVIYIIKENRTYDQVFGDLSQADGDPSLVFFPRRVSPNHHALAERFGIFDRFFVNAEVSPDGHNWSTAAYVTDYAEKTIPSNYSSRGRTYDYQGTNRNVIPNDDVSEPSSGYLWDLANRAGITYRDYGEFVDEPEEPPGPNGPAFVATKPALVGHTNTAYSGFNLQITDQSRTDIWLKEFQEYVREGKLPALEIMTLPNDHTSGARAGMPTPRAYMADNDLALGRIIEALSKSQFWKNTVVFVLEDDAQDGPDHVDSHRSPLLVISPYNRGKVFHRFANTTDVVATIEDILGLGRMSQFDQYGRPLRDIWETTPDLTPYTPLVSSVPLDEKNPQRGALAEASKKLTLEKEDTSPDDLFNRILWGAIKGDKPYPGPTRMSALEAKASR
jgi:YVTN family beta-propeller protein